MVIAVAALLVGACMSASMSTGLTQLSADTYRLYRLDGGGRYPDAAALKVAVVEEADAFARSKGKVAVPLSSRDETMRAGHLSSVEYEFRLAAAGEPAGNAAEPVPRAAAAVDAQERGTASVAAPAAAAAASTAAVQPAAKVAEVQPAAAAAVTAVPAQAPNPTDAKPDLYHELIMLDDLRKRGILTDAEFQALKTKLLAGK